MDLPYNARTGGEIHGKTRGNSRCVAALLLFAIASGGAGRSRTPARSTRSPRPSRTPGRRRSNGTSRGHPGAPRHDLHPRRTCPSYQEKEGSSWALAAQGLCPSRTWPSSTVSACRSARTGGPSSTNRPTARRTMHFQKGAERVDVTIGPEQSAAIAEITLNIRSTKP